MTGVQQRTEALVSLGGVRLHSDQLCVVRVAPRVRRTRAESTAPALPAPIVRSTSPIVGAHLSQVGLTGGNDVLLSGEYAVHPKLAGANGFPLRTTPAPAQITDATSRAARIQCFMGEK